MVKIRGFKAQGIDNPIALAKKVTPSGPSIREQLDRDSRPTWDQLRNMVTTKEKGMKEAFEQYENEIYTEELKRAREKKMKEGSDQTHLTDKIHNPYSLRYAMAELHKDAPSSSSSDDDVGRDGRRSDKDRYNDTVNPGRRKDTHRTSATREGGGDDMHRNSNRERYRYMGDGKDTQSYVVGDRNNRPTKESRGDAAVDGRRNFQDLSNDRRGRSRSRSRSRQHEQERRTDSYRDKGRERSRERGRHRSRERVGKSVRNEASIKLRERDRVYNWEDGNSK